MMKKKEFRNLTGVEKCAIFILSLDEERASKVMSLLDESEIQILSQTMAALGSINSNIVEDLFLDFSQKLATASSVIGSFDQTEKFLSKILPSDKVNSIMSEIKGPIGKTIWDKVSNINDEVFLNFLKNEHPQTICVILTKIRPDQAARLLRLFPDDMAQDIILRMLSRESFPKEILDDVEQTLRVEFMTNYAKISSKNNFTIVAEIFNCFDKEYEDKIVERIEKVDKESIIKVKALMFTFKDLAKIPRAGIEILMRNIDKTKLPTALKGADDEIKELFFSCMSQRALKLLQEEMLTMGPVRVKDVIESQDSIIQKAKELIEAGEIFIPEENDGGGFIE